MKLQLNTGKASDAFEYLFSKAGVSPDTLVILYEDGLASRFGGSFRGWWWLNFFGHEKVIVMDDSDSPTFRSPDEIRAIMSDAGVNTDDDIIIIYCFKGSRASNTFAALKSAEFTKLRNDLGSWYEWAVDESLPVEMGTR